MTRFIIYRVISIIPVVIGITIAVFVSVRLVPGDPIDLMFSNSAKPTPERRAQMEREMGLEGPMYKQYVTYMTNLLHGDMGKSYRTKRDVTESIRTRVGNTVKLTICSLAVALVIGLTAGILSATFRNSWLDRISMLIAVAGVSIPAFWLGLMFILLFSVKLGWLPVAGARTWKHLVLPSLTLGIVVSAVLARITRASMIEALSQDYVRTARAKGLRESVVVYRHALRNALIPVITIVGLLIGSLLAGAFIIEAVYGYPGIGLLAVNALQTRDFPLIQGIVLIIALTYVVINLLVDILYGLIDPRIKFS